MERVGNGCNHRSRRHSTICYLDLGTLRRSWMFIYSMSEQKIRFIINPRSGTRFKQEIKRVIAQYLNHQVFEYDFQYTEYPHHATELAKVAVEENVDIVVAVGGDGSVNEVAAGLIGTDTILGILPMGSGNGFAGHLGLGRGAKYALQVLNQRKFVTIDTCTINGMPFVNLVGFGRLSQIFASLVTTSIPRSNWTKHIVLNIRLEI